MQKPYVSLTHPKEIQARLGHSTITTTLDSYGHLIPGLGRQLAANLDEMRKKAVSDVRQMWTNDDAEIVVPRAGRRKR